MKFAKAMLATKTNPDRLIALVEDDTFWAEQKVDGHRCLMHVQDGQVRAVTRNGNDVAGVPPHIFRQFDGMIRTGQRWVLDGEWLGGVFYVFDIIQGGGQSFADESYENRRMVLENFFEQWQPVGVVLLPVSRTLEEKVELTRHVIDEGCEGLVFKKTSSRYVQRRSEEWRKIKFRNEIDCQVMDTRRRGHSNIIVGVLRDGVLTEVGECTAEAGDGRKAQVGDIVSITYQYASEDNKLVQPTKPILRRDKDEPDTWDDLVWVNKEVFV